MKIRTIGKSSNDYMDAPNLERVLVTCECGFKFETITDAWVVTCPKCNNKTNRIKDNLNIKEGDIKNG